MRKLFKILFLIVSVITIFEYLFIYGMFTGPMVMLFVVVLGIINLILDIKDKDYYGAALYTICTVALSMGYWKLMF